ncbi:MAG: hypothetical protein K8S56_07955 [Candidatus Cloacimonetes bacterium]|nr:hypothetical protein [Candidatus Cloacimonadota bacterium]
MQHYIPNLKRHILLKSSITRNYSGKVTGAVIGIYNIERDKKKHEAKKENDGTVS